MPEALRVLLIEDSEDDAVLEMESLEAKGLALFWMRVETRQQLAEALDHGTWDLVLSDYTLPAFDGLTALHLVRQRDSEIPFILVSGTIGEDIAADAVRNGANDFVLKNKLWRLVPVIERELRDVETRRSQRRAENALRESERKYRSLVEQALDGIFIIDKDGRILEANRSALTMTRFVESEIRGKRMDELFRSSGDEAAASRKLLQRKDGSVFYADISSTALQDENVLLIVRDVTEQVESEKILRRRERHQSAIAQLGRAATNGMAQDSLITYAADLASRALEMEYCRIAQHGENGPSNIVRAGCPRDPSDRPCTVTSEYIQGTVSAGGPVPFVPGETTPVDPCFSDLGIVDGFSVGIGTSERPLGVIDLYSRKPHPLSDDDRAFLEALTNVLSSAIDQKTAQEALRRSELRFRRYFELGLVGMVTTSPATLCLDVNDRFCEILGYERNELLAKTWQDVTHPEDLRADLEQFNRVLAGEIDGYSLEKRFIRKDGRVIDGRISVAGVRRTDRSIDHFVALVDDISERKAAEREIFQRQQEFKALVENAPDIITRFGPDYRRRYVNPAAERLTGIPRSELIAKSNRELGFADELGAQSEEALDFVFATAQETTTEFSFLSPSGTRFMQSRFVPEFGLDGKVEHALVITRDITAIRASEERARERERQLAAAQRIAAMGSFDLDLRSGAMAWSEELFHILDLPPGQPADPAQLFQLVEEDDRELVRHAYEAALHGEPRCFECRVTVGGSAKTFSIHLEPARNAGGEVVKLSGTAQDVTALREAEHRMRDLIESANDAILTLDTNGIALDVNPAVVRLMGEPAEVLKGRHITHSVHPDYVLSITKGLQQVVETGTIAHIDAPVRNANGDWVHIEASASRQTRQGSKLIFVIARDVTAQRRAEEERKALTGEIQLLLESTYEGICAADTSGRCTLVNAAAARMLGYPARELMGKELHSLIHNQRADGSPYPTDECPMMKAGTDGQPAHVTNELFWRRDGTSFPVEIFVSPIFTETKTIKGIVASFIDVTERNLLQTELERANRLTGLGRVAATMSHEFNNVLMGIQPFAEVVLGSSQDDRVTAAAQRIIQSVRRGRRVTEELRGFTRPVVPVRTPIDVRSWLSDCSAEFAEILPHRIRFELDVADGEMTVDADRDQITQVINNLIVNARDAMGNARGTITLSAREVSAGEKFSAGALPPGESFVHFSVADDGPGIGGEVLARIFEPFFSTKQNGTGLGLAITQQIISLHGGHLFVDSKPGSGTVVHFFLRRRVQVECATTEPLPAYSGCRKVPEEILLVEDDESVAIGLRALLEMEDVHVLLAGNGAEAIALLAEHKPDALVIDVGLPDCSGFDLYDRIAGSHGPLPVVFSSGHADVVTIDETIVRAKVRLLTKPYVIDTLLAALEEIWEPEFAPH